MKKILISLCTIVLCFVLIGCGKENTITGKWEYKDKDAGYTITYEFNSDETGNWHLDNGDEKSSKEFTYTVDDKNIEIIFKDDEDNLKYNYTYELEDDILTLSDSLGEVNEFRKK